MLDRLFFFTLIFAQSVAWGYSCIPVTTPKTCSANQSPGLISLAAISAATQKLQLQNLKTDIYTTHQVSSVMKSHSEVAALSDNTSSDTSVIHIDPNIKHQKMWGFGAAITDSCLANMDRLSSDQRKNLMTKMFDPEKGAGLNILRLPIGSNDFALSGYSLDDTPGNKPDPKLKNFNPDHLQPLIQFANEAKKYNPHLEVMITPWSPPAWMKDTKSLNGGQLQKKYFGAYADYLIKSIRVLQAHGVAVKQMSILNEPLIWDAHEKWGYAQSFMNEKDQLKFIQKFLIPRLEKMPSPPHVLLHDHNWGNGKLTLAMTKNEKLNPLISGVAYHCYGGDLSNLQASLQQQNRSLASINTECSSTQTDDNNKGTFQWWMKTQSVDAVRSGTSGALGWNLCLDENGGPHLKAGCENCRGLATIHSGDNPQFQLNAEFHALAQTSHYVQPGAFRIESSDPQVRGLQNVAFENPDGSKVLVIRNSSDQAQTVSTQMNGCEMGSTSIPAGGAVTLKWPKE